MIDPIVSEVRKNREELFAEFNFDSAKLRENIESQRRNWEGTGVRYVTLADMENRRVSGL